MRWLIYEIDPGVNLIKIFGVTLLTHFKASSLDSNVTNFSYAYKMVKVTRKCELIYTKIVL